MPRTKPKWSEFGRRLQEYSILHPEQRVGQVIFNVFSEFFPEEATRLAGTEEDPFYSNDPFIAQTAMYKWSLLFKEVPDEVRAEASRRGIG